MRVFDGGRDLFALSSVGDEAELIAFCGDRIAGYKKPRRVEFRDELPRNSAGKIDKVSLRKPFWEGRDRQV